MQTPSFKTALQNALLRREPRPYSSLCLVAPHEDGLSDLVIHNYEGHCFIQTHSKERDTQIPLIVDILFEHTKPISIWLKNHGETRQKKQLPLSEQLLHGQDVQNLAIHEALHTFSYPTHSRELFPLYERALRHELANALQTDSSVKKILHLSPKAHCWEEQMVSCEHVDLTAPFWAETCEQLRQLAKKETYNLCLLKMPECIDSEKNKKALFHVFFNSLRLIPKGTILMQCHAKNHWLLGLLSKAATAQKQTLWLQSAQNADLDFPRKISRKNNDLLNTYRMYLMS